jgi:imidazolonepropionase-like amidohydrolase
MRKSRHDIHPHVVCLLILSVALAAGLRADDALHRVWAVKDCRIVTPGGPVLEKAVIVIRDGLIEAVGAGIAVPPDAEVIDAANLTAYPGLIDGLGKSLLKLPEEKFDMTKVYSGDYNDKDRGITPDLRAFDYVSLGKSVFEKYYKYGFTAAQVMPDRGILTGRSSFFCLSDPDKNKSLLLRDVCLGIGFSPPGLMAYPSSLMGLTAYLKQILQDSVFYDAGRDRWNKDMRGIARPDYNPVLEVLSDHVAGRKPVIFLCRNQNDIRRALALVAGSRLDAVICDLGNEASDVIPELKKAKARVLVTVAFKAPPSNLYSQKGKAEREKAEKEVYPKNPARLAEAGIPFAFSSLDTDDPKTFIEGILKAIDAGLPQDKALAALTAAPASFFGLDRTLGTIEPGKIANIVLAEGDLLVKDAKVRYAFADGKRFELKEAKVKEGEKPTVSVSGKWELAAEGVPKLTVDFVQEETALSGKMVTPFGVFDFTGGSVSANQVDFEMTISVGGQEISLYISGTVEGDTMRGTIVQDTEGSVEFTAKRIPG